jgi:predicted N-acetyltransferase YhbS
MSAWTLRPATPADAPRIASLLRDAFAEYEGRLTPPSGAHAETADSVREKLTTAEAVLALDGEAAAGCVFYRPEEDHLYFFRLAVVPACRRRGLGQVLIEHVEGRARALGLAWVRLGVRVVLAGQRAYYERLGYRPVAAAAHPGFTEPTYLIMEKDLTPPRG